MMPAATCSALAIPHLAPAVPLKMLITGRDVLAAPLAIALLEADVITTGMLRHPKNDQMTAGDLAGRGLSKWWDSTIQENSCKFFRWQLHVQRLEAYDHDAEYNGHAWFIFTRMTDEMPQFALEKRVTQLEHCLEGLGQTVLAVLKDATNHLPESYTPWRAIDFAEYQHWGDSKNDAELLEDYRHMNGYATIQEVIDRGDVLTREQFYSDVPRWVTDPRRVLSRAAIGAADLGLLGSRVVAVCDEIAQLVNDPSFTLHPADRGVYRTRQESVEASMFLFWHSGDVIGQVTDDARNHMWQVGDHHDFIDATPVPMTAAGIRHFQNLFEQTMKLAVLTEKLILLIGEHL